MSRLIRCAAAVFVVALLPFMPAKAGTLVLLDPYLLGASSLSDIDLAQLLPQISDLQSVRARGLVADNSSAAIALYRSNERKPVTFDVSNGATLLPYGNDFLTTAPAAGETTLRITPDQMFQIGDRFYAAVLVQSPLAGIAPDFTSKIRVTAHQHGDKDTRRLDLVPPPVVVVHGLWGDGSSLSNIVQALRDASPWSAHTELVQAIQYDMDLAYDYSEPTSPPSRTPPATVLGSAIQSLFDTLDSENIVGRRVDIVAHSMGGLVSRYFAGLDAYRGLADREQGQFHEIVTIDTPELGSALATFLDQNHGARQISPPATEATLVWFGQCNSLGTTVMSCFDSGGMPLVPLSGAFAGNLQKGPIVPQEPGSADLSALPDPNIPDAIWRAVSATAPKDSAIGRALDDLVAAIYSSRNKAPTVDQILGDTNDAIVTVPSQIADAADGQFATLPNLSHTLAPDSFITLMHVLGVRVDNDNVTDSTAVIDLMRCWLLNAEGADGGATCLPTGQTVAEETQTPPTPPVSATMANRLHPAAPTKATLFQPLEVPVTVDQASQLQSLYLQQSGVAPEAVTASRRVGNVLYVPVTPHALGPVTLKFAARFSDGAVAMATAKIEVAPPKTAPQTFDADGNFSRIRLGLEPGTNMAQLHPLAIYAAAPDVPVDVRGFAKFSLAPSSEAGTVTVGADGTVTALHPGKATVAVTFGTARATIDIVVRKLEH